MAPIRANKISFGFNSYFGKSSEEHLQKGTVFQLTPSSVISVIRKNLGPISSFEALSVYPYFGLSQYEPTLTTFQLSGISPISVCLVFSPRRPLVNRCCMVAFLSSLVDSIIFSCTSIAFCILYSTAAIFVCSGRG